MTLSDADRPRPTPNPGNDRCGAANRDGFRCRLHANHGDRGWGYLHAGRNTDGDWVQWRHAHRPTPTRYQPRHGAYIAPITHEQLMAEALNHSAAGLGNMFLHFLGRDVA